MSHRLRLEYIRDNDRTGELIVSAARLNFSGVGRAYFHDREIDAFGRALAETYPLAAGSEIRLQGGHWQSGSNPPLLNEALVRLRVYPVGTTGTIAISVELIEENTEDAAVRTRSSAKFQLLTNYEPLRSFGRQFSALLYSSPATAELELSAA